MATVTTLPNATVANPPTNYASSYALQISAGTVHGVLSDGSDANNVYNNSGSNHQAGAVIRCALPVIPAGGKLKEFRFRIRSLTFSPWGGVVRVQAYDTYNGSLHQNMINGGTLYPTGRLGMIFTGGSYVTRSLPGSIVPASGSLPTNLDIWLELEGLSGNTYATEFYVDTIYAAKPVTDPVTPTGTITTTSTPAVSWVNTLDADGGDQAYYHVKIYRDDQYLAGGFNPDSTSPHTESGLTEGNETSWTPLLALADDTYRAYVKVYQLINGELHASDWAYEGFVINVPDPGTPTLAAVAGPDHVKLTATETAGGVATTNFEIQRSDDGGTTWDYIRTIDGDGRLANSGGTGIAYDHEMPANESVLYRSRAVAGNTVSDWSSTASVTWTAHDWWMKHPSDPRLNLKVEVFSEPGYQRETNVGYLKPLGATLPISVTDLRSGRSGTLVLSLDEDGELDDLLEDGSPILVQAPEGQGWSDRWVLLERQASGRMVDKLQALDRLDTFAWVEVQTPLGDVVSGGWS